MIIFTSLHAIIANTLLIYFMKNPVYSLILLVLNYFIVGFLFIFNGLVFLGLIFVIVYTGAVSILLLFTFMLLDLRSMYYRSLDTKHYINVYISLLFVEFFFFWLIKKKKKIYYSADSAIYSEWYDFAYLKADFSNLGHDIYVNNPELVLIVSIFLTFLLISSTNLVNSPKESKKQKASDQLKIHSLSLVEN